MIDGKLIVDALRTETYLDIILMASLFFAVQCICIISTRNVLQFYLAITCRDLMGLYQRKMSFPKVRLFRFPSTFMKPLL